MSKAPPSTQFTVPGDTRYLKKSGSTMAKRGGQSSVTYGGEIGGGNCGNRDLGYAGGSVKRHPITTPAPVSPSLSTTTEEEGVLDNRKRVVQTREGRANRRVIAKARTLINQARANVLKKTSINVAIPACTLKDATETKKERMRERKRLQNRRSIEKCRLRELGRLKSLNDEKGALTHETQVLSAALSDLRASGVLEIVAAVHACTGT